MVFDVLSSVVPNPEAFGYAEMTLARLRGYQQHFGSSRDKIPLIGDNEAQNRAMAESFERGKAMCPDEEQFMAMLDPAVAGRLDDQYRRVASLPVIISR